MQGIYTTIGLVDRMTAPIMSITHAVDNLVNQFNAVEAAADIDNTSLGAMRQKVDIMNSLTGQTNQIMAMLGDTIDQNTYGQGNFNNSLVRSNSLMGQLVNQAKGAIAAYASIRGVQSAMGLSDTLTQTNARLELIVDDGGSVEELQNRIFASAQNARGSFLQTADAISKLGMQASQAFSSNDELIGFTELLNKSFVNAGTSVQGVSSVMLQLTQAMAAGRLQGEELNAVLDNAAPIAQNIQRYLQEVQGFSPEATENIKQLASDGVLTAGIIKSAMFYAADEINEKFESMPMTWGQVWQSFKNQALFAFQPVLQRINEIANSPGIQTFVNNAVGAMVKLSNVALDIFNTVGSVAQFIADTWSMVAPIILSVAAAMGVYWAVTKGVVLAQTIGAAVSAAYHAAQTFLSIGFGILTGSTAAASAAVFTFNSALMASPLTWILMLIIAIIGVLYAVVAAVNHFAGTTVSATGIIAGSFMWLFALIGNALIGTINAMIQFIWTLFVEPFLGIIEFILNVCNGGFDSFGAGVANLIGQVISWFLSLGKVVTTIIDAIFGTDWTAGLSSLQDSVLSWGKNENAITLDRNAPLIDHRFDMTDAFDMGYSFGEGIDKRVAGMFDFSVPGMDDYGSGSTNDLLSQIANNTGDIAGNTGKQLNYSEEEMKLWRDLAEKQAVDRYTTVQIDMGGFTTNNNVSSNMDLDGIVEYVSERTEEALHETLAWGVYK